MARILGIDFGTKRVGFAVTDPNQIIVSPLAVVTRAEAVRFFSEYLSNEAVDRVVCGMPGERYQNTRKALREFVAELKPVLGDIPLVYQDEHLTSQKASEIIFQSGVGKMKRRDKGLVDKVSAVLILQEYLGHLKDVYMP
jgi:putative Holliday junction resolvase